MRAASKANDHHEASNVFECRVLSTLLAVSRILPCHDIYNAIPAQFCPTPHTTKTNQKTSTGSYQTYSFELILRNRQHQNTSTAFSWFDGSQCFSTTGTSSLPYVSLVAHSVTRLSSRPSLLATAKITKVYHVLSSLHTRAKWLTSRTQHRRLSSLLPSSRPRSLTASRVASAKRVPRSTSSSTATE